MNIHSALIHFEDLLRRLQKLPAEDQQLFLYHFLGSVRGSIGSQCREAPAIIDRLTESLDDFSKGRPNTICPVRPIGPIKTTA